MMRKKTSSWSGLGGVRPIVVRSLGAGSDKGETELRLPLRRFFGLCGPCVVVVCLFWRYCAGLDLSSFPCVYLAFALSHLCLRPRKICRKDTQ